MQRRRPETGEPPDRRPVITFSTASSPRRRIAVLSPIEVARRTGRSLVIAGIVQDEGYFRAEVLPHVDGAVAAVAQVGTFDRPAIRAIAVERFGVGRMVAEYAALYERVLAA